MYALNKINCVEMVFREEKELIDIIAEFKDLEAPTPSEANYANLEIVMLRIEEYLHDRIIGGEPSFDTEPPNASVS